MTFEEWWLKVKLEPSDFRGAMAAWEAASDESDKEIAELRAKVAELERQIEETELESKEGYPE